MPPSPIEERRPAITPQLAVRVAVLGGIGFVLFAILFFRLWFLQVLTGQEYVSQARENRSQRIRVEAPRGDIVDRNGRVLVRTRIAPVVQIVPSALPEVELQLADQYRAASSAAENRRLKAGGQLKALQRRLREDGRKSTRTELARRRALKKAASVADPVAIPPVPADETALNALFRRLGHVIGVTPRTIQTRVIEGIADAPYANVTLKTDVSRAAYSYLLEHRESFPGIEVDKKYLRDYPYKTLGAQLFGTVNQISPEQLKEKQYRGVKPGTRIGTDGLEETYDQYLRGTDGYTRVVVDALGNRDDTRAATVKEPIQGNRLRLTIDLGLERAGYDAIQRGIAVARTNGNNATAGAYVALDPRNGEVLGLGSYPSFDANDFAKPISKERYDQLNSEANGAPLLDRAIAGSYATGSTFKPITALASLEAGIIGVGTTIFDSGKFKIGNLTLQNAKGASYGAIAITQALKVSSDVFFYTLGERADPLKGQVIQTWARKLGLGSRTGIDLPGEQSGLVPDAAWRNAGYQKYLKCVDEQRLAAGTTPALYACGGIERSWTTGDNVGLAIGQGDLLATPLQVATAYSAIVNGGTVVRPHLGQRIEDVAGRQIEELPWRAKRHVKIDGADRAAIMSGLHKAAQEPGGTSDAVFGDFPRTIYGKTGTVQKIGQPDQSWYVAYAPSKARPIVIVVTIEGGGFGAETAAPAARLMLSEWFDLGERDFKAGTVED
jgi:penicillin-binding protein 2